MHRLDSRAPELAKALRGAPLALQRRAVIVACEVATARVGLDADDVVAALGALRTDSGVDPALRLRLEALATRLDDEYLGLAQLGDAPKKGVLSLFFKARAASALVFAFSTDAEQLHEAIYEAIAAVEDPSEVIRRSMEALRP